MNTGIVRATEQDGRAVRVYFVDDSIPRDYSGLFAHYGLTTLLSFGTPYVLVSCKNKVLARQCASYARKIDNWDTGEAINWAQNVEPLYLKCDRLALKYQSKPSRAAFHIRNAILASGVLQGTGVRVSLVDWQGVASVFIDSL